MNYLAVGSIEKKNIEIGMRYSQWRRQDKLIKAIGTVVVRAVIGFNIAVMLYSIVLIAMGRI